MNTFSRLLMLLAPFKRWIALAVLLSFLTIGSSVGLMAMSSYLISRSALISEVYAVAIPITLVRVFATLRAAFRYLERYVTHTATFRILTHLRAWFYESIEPLAPARLLAYRSGDLLARIVGDVETLESFYVRVVVPPITAALVTVLACLILGSFDATLAIALLAFLALTGVLLPLASRGIARQPAAALIATRAELNATLVDQVQGIADLLSFDRAASRQEHVLQLSHELCRWQERMAMLRAASNALGALFTSLAGLTVLGLAIPLVSSGAIDGVFLALLPLTAIASFEAVQPLSLAVQQLAANQAAGRRLFELITDNDAAGVGRVSYPAHAPAGNGDRPTGYAVELRDARFAYAPGEPLALDGVSFSVAEGTRVAIIGPNGSGKSTIANLLLRFWDCQQGQVCVGGRDVRDYAEDDLRRLLAVVPQQVHLFNATIRANLLLANPDASEEQIAAACTMAQLDDFVRGLPQGYNTPIGENGLLLSGGERQRLAIARAILKNAPIVIFDEATANLDALTQQRLMRSLEPFLHGRTTLIISPRLTAWPNVDKVVRLEQGHVV